jgi:hypothetical protein
MSIVDPAQDFDVAESFLGRASEPVGFLVRFVEEGRDGESRLVQLDRLG